MERWGNEVLSWDETKKYSKKVKEIGIVQFINLYKNFKDLQGFEYKWGDEIEYALVKFCPEQKQAKVSLRAEKVLLDLKGGREKSGNLDSIWMCEYASYMAEGIPGMPYGGALSDYLNVEANMKLRREELQSKLDDDEKAMMISNFPRLGCPEFTFPEFPPHPQTSVLKSHFYPNELIYQGVPRYFIATRNMVMRAGSKMDIHIPIWKDASTQNPFLEPSIPEQIPDMIYLDGMGFGFCCLQVTFQAKNIKEARELYDNLAVLTPILMVLTAATPFQRGYISDLDSRWSVIGPALDDRTSDEKIRILKSRCGSIDCFISEENTEYNDIPVLYEEDHYKTLVEAGIDSTLAQHVAHLFIRDPLILTPKDLDFESNASNSAALFENIQTTNWGTVRFKPPPFNSTSMGWRVEFRACDLQLTDFENACIASFLSLVTQTILHYNLTFLIPISKVDENIEKAQLKDAIMNQTFCFRKNIENKQGTETRFLTIDEIFNGNDEFIGLLSWIERYLKEKRMEPETSKTLRGYLSFISRRAKGELMTGAKWLRHFVVHHPAYQKDSIITQEINYDLLTRVGELANTPCPLLHGSISEWPTFGKGT